MEKEFQNLFFSFQFQLRNFVSRTKEFIKRRSSMESIFQLLLIFIPCSFINCYIRFTIRFNILCHANIVRSVYGGHFFYKIKNARPSFRNFATDFLPESLRVNIFKCRGENQKLFRIMLTLPHFFYCFVQNKTIYFFEKTIIIFTHQFKVPRGKKVISRITLFASNYLSISPPQTFHIKFFIKAFWVKNSHFGKLRQVTNMVDSPKHFVFGMIPISFRNHSLNFFFRFSLRHFLNFLLCHRFCFGLAYLRLFSNQQFRRVLRFQNFSKSKREFLYLWHNRHLYAVYSFIKSCCFSTCAPHQNNFHSYQLANFSKSFSGFLGTTRFAVSKINNIFRVFLSVFFAACRKFFKNFFKMISLFGWALSVSSFQLLNNLYNTARIRFFTQRFLLNCFFGISKARYTKTHAFLVSRFFQLNGKQCALNHLLLGQILCASCFVKKQRGSPQHFLFSKWVGYFCDQRFYPFSIGLINFPLVFIKPFSFSSFFNFFICIKVRAKTADQFFRHIIISDFHRFSDFLFRFGLILRRRLVPKFRVFGKVSGFARFFQMFAIGRLRFFYSFSIFAVLVIKLFRRFWHSFYDNYFIKTYKKSRLSFLNV